MTNSPNTVRVPDALSYPDKNVLNDPSTLRTVYLLIEVILCLSKYCPHTCSPIRLGLPFRVIFLSFSWLPYLTVSLHVFNSMFPICCEHFRCPLDLPYTFRLIKDEVKY